MMSELYSWLSPLFKDIYIFRDWTTSSKDVVIWSWTHSFFLKIFKK